MASNLKTPRSVRLAPSAMHVYIHVNAGSNRAERRAHVVSFRRRSFIPWHNEPFKDRYPSSNEPYVKPKKVK